MFGNIFERRERKCCAVLMKHCRKVKGEQVIALQMAQQLKTKISMLYQDTYFVISVKPIFVKRQTHCIDHQNKFVKDTNNELNECQTPKKKLQSTRISPVSLHVFIKTLTLFRIRRRWWGQKGPH